MNEIIPFNLPTGCCPVVLKKFIADFEQAIIECGEPIEIPIEHRFSKGVYGREMKIKAGEIIVGKIHKHQTMNVILSGEASVLSPEGVTRIKAPLTFVSPPGTKRVIYAHTDLVWATFHGTNETDLEKIENEVIAKNYDEAVPLKSGIKEEK